MSAAGVWLWDAQGRVIVDTSTAMTTLIGSRVASAPFSVSHPLFSKGVPWYFYFPRGAYAIVPGGGGISGSGTPSVSFSGNTMTVNGSLFDGTFLYGIY